MLVRRGAPGLRLRLLFEGASILSKRLRPGLIAVSKGFRGALPRIRSPLGAVGRSVRRIGCPAAFAPSNSPMARFAKETVA